MVDPERKARLSLSRNVMVSLRCAMFRVCVLVREMANRASHHIGLVRRAYEVMLGSM